MIYVRIGNNGREDLLFSFKSDHPDQDDACSICDGYGRSVDAFSWYAGQPILRFTPSGLEVM